MSCTANGPCCLCESFFFFCMGVTGWRFLLVTAHPGNPGQNAIKWLCVCLCLSQCWVFDRHLQLYLHCHWWIMTNGFSAVSFFICCIHLYATKLWISLFLYFGCTFFRLTGNGRPTTLLPNSLFIIVISYQCFQCFDTAGFASGRASGL